MPEPGDGAVRRPRFKPMRSATRDSSSALDAAIRASERAKVEALLEGLSAARSRGGCTRGWRGR